MPRVLFIAPLLVVILSGAARAQDHTHAAPAGEELGSVHFATSCSADAAAGFDRAVALLHSFEFGAAMSAFDGASKQDPSCAMTEWGVALSRWGNPFAVGSRSPQQLQQGLAAVERARAIGARTDRERGYIDAVATLYGDADRRPQQARVEAY